LATAAATTMSGHHHQSTELLRGEYDWLVSKEGFGDAGNKRAKSSPSSSSSQFAASLSPREYTPKNASAPTTTTAGINVEPTPATGAEKVFEPIRLSPDDWLIYLRIQKTGSQTFWFVSIRFHNYDKPKKEIIRGVVVSVEYPYLMQKMSDFNFGYHPIIFL